MSSQDEIGKSQSLANEVGVVEQVGVEVFQDLLYEGFSGIDGLLVVGISSDSGTEPGSERGKDFGIREGTPLNDFSICFGVLGDKSCIRVLLGDYTSVIILN